MFRGFREFEDDPFFRDHQERTNNTFRMFDRPFGFGNPPFALEGPTRDQYEGDRMRDHRDRDATDERHRDGRRDMAYGEPFGGIFPNMNSMFGNMERHFERAANNPNSYTYSQSSVMSYSNDGRGEPKYYQAHTSTKKAPGGIKETQRAVKDSESGVDRMAIGHHIGDKGHVVARSLNRRTNEEERKQDFINMNETDAQTFDSEWKHKTRTSMNNRHLGGRGTQRGALEEPGKRDHHEHGRDRHHSDREERRHRAVDGGHRGHREEGRGRDDGYRGHREEGRDDGRRVRVNSRPVNRHAPREGWD